jgi:acetoin:2,6-dichlorophenolindophenol oxidoreductase subunit beta
MTEIDLGGAIDIALEQAMASDETILVIGEDVHMMRRGLFARFGSDRVRAAPISESAFLGAGVGAALGGLRPVVEIMFVDFLAVALHALSNEAALIDTLSGGRWKAPVLIRAACGGGYGDAGQHEQSLWGMLSSLPGIAVVVPSTSADAAGLTLTALQHPGPVLLLEHKLLSSLWRESVAGSARSRAALDVPAEESWDPHRIRPIPFGEAKLVKGGDDALLVSVGRGVHLALEAAQVLAGEGTTAGVLDLRTTAPLDRSRLIEEASRVDAVVVVDEDYGPFGLSAEVGAVLAETGSRVPFSRVAATGAIPYARHLEAEVLPSVSGVVDAVRRLMAGDE